MDKRIQQLEKRIAELEAKLGREQFDNTSMGKLNQAMIPYYFNKINVRRVFLTTGNAVNPSQEGEVVYHSTTPSIKVMLNGVVRTFTVS